MPKGKELEQLPAANTAPGAEEDRSRHGWEILNDIEQNERPQPSKRNKENEDMV